MLVVVGSKNPAKISAAKIAFEKVFPEEKIKVVAADVKSGVSHQPMSDDESIQGATNRAKAALKAVKNADFAVGMEGGVHQIVDKWFESGWIAIINKEGKLGLATSARWQIGGKVMKRLDGSNELAKIFENIAGVENAKDKAGVMGLVTNNHLSRDIVYSQGVIFALAPFFGNSDFWD